MVDVTYFIFNDLLRSSGPARGWPQTLLALETDSRESFAAVQKTVQ